MSTIVSGTKFVFPTACIAGIQTPTCAAAIANTIYQMFKWGGYTPVDICGTRCEGRLKGRLYGLRWKWNAEFRCPSISPRIVGKATKLSRGGSMEHAINDWVAQATRAGVISEADFRC